MDEKYHAIVITVSDRASAGVYEDGTGPAVAALLTERGYAVIETRVVPDERADIEAALVEAAEKDAALVLTCGGTGFSPRDVTPEATEAVCERRVPGLPEAMRAASARITDRAWLSRATAGIRGCTLIVNLPGSPRAAVENLEAVVGPLAHGLDILRGGPATCARESRQ
ncbi:MAG TPA: MogA/MoaB family molybdenum cofactor biosynthesis protein [Candidatus Olsenella avicola]|nr:MogA/MoaB family molybdenum cofactor biosynthesis protein [Candidatus Olsenella avicola]